MKPPLHPFLGCDRDLSRYLPLICLNCSNYAPVVKLVRLPHGNASFTHQCSCGWTKSYR